MTTAHEHPTAREAAASRGWRDETVLQLKALWAHGDLSAAMIAERLGVSRNAVLGKVHRLGLSRPRRARKAVPKPAPRRPVRSAPPRRPHPPASPPDELEPRVERLERVPAHACHWPIGDPGADGFGFCGRDAPGRPYCDLHWRRAHRPW